jgi:hypothetical protein
VTSAGKASIHLPPDDMKASIGIARAEFADLLVAAGLDGSGGFTRVLADEREFQSALTRPSLLGALSTVPQKSEQSQLARVQSDPVHGPAASSSAWNFQLPSPPGLLRVSPNNHLAADAPSAGPDDVASVAAVDAADADAARGIKRKRGGSLPGTVTHPPIDVTVTGELEPSNTGEHPMDSEAVHSQRPLVAGPEECKDDGAGACKQRRGYRLHWLADDDDGPDRGDVGATAFAAPLCTTDDSLTLSTVPDARCGGSEASTVIKSVKIDADFDGVPAPLSLGLHQQEPQLRDTEANSANGTSNACHRPPLFDSLTNDNTVPGISSAAQTAHCEQQFPSAIVANMHEDTVDLTNHAAMLPESSSPDASQLQPPATSLEMQWADALDGLL